MLKNILLNALKLSNSKIMIMKAFKRLEKNNPEKSKQWAQNHLRYSVEEYCKNLDKKIGEESLTENLLIRKKADTVLANIPFSLGGSGAYPLLYFLVRKYKPEIIIETGVAAGWSSKAILRACNKNKSGKLYSSDFPYFRLKNPEQYIGILLSNEDKSRWNLNTHGDSVALPIFLKDIGDRKINLFHYDSDKSYSGRTFALNLIKRKFAKDAVLIIDDIEDNFHFRDFVLANKLNYKILEFNGKSVGLILNVGKQLAE